MATMLATLWMTGDFDELQRVLLLGIDGLRADAAAMLPLPNLHRLSTMGTSTVSTCTCNTYKSNHNMSMSWVIV